MLYRSMLESIDQIRVPQAWSEPDRAAAHARLVRRTPPARAQERRSRHPQPDRHRHVHGLVVPVQPLRGDPRRPPPRHQTARSGTSILEHPARRLHDGLFLLENAESQRAGRWDHDPPVGPHLEEPSRRRGVADEIGSADASPPTTTCARGTPGGCAADVEQHRRRPCLPSALPCWSVSCAVRRVGHACHPALSIPSGLSSASDELRCTHPRNLLAHVFFLRPRITLGAEGQPGQPGSSCRARPLPPLRVEPDL